MSVEEKQGVSRLEQVVEEIFEAEKVKEVRREQKRQKRRARRREKCKYGELSNNGDTHNENLPIAENLAACQEVLIYEERNCHEVTDDRSNCETEETYCGEVSKYYDELPQDSEHCSCDGKEPRNGECHEESEPGDYDSGCIKWQKHVSDTCSSTAHRCKTLNGRNGLCDEVGNAYFPDGDERHDEFPVDDEEKQLLLSMGWMSSEPCQVCMTSF